MIRRGTSPLFCVLCAICLGACSSAPRTAGIPPAEPLSITGDGAFQYRVPPGWFDASGDSSNGRYLIWLVRHDYGATIGLQQFSLDEQTQRVMNEGGLRAIAELSRALSAPEQGGSSAAPPDGFTVQGMRCYSYELARAHLSDSVRVIVFEAGGTVYELTAVAVGDGADPSEVFSIQQGVLASLHRPSL